MNSKNKPVVLFPMQLQLLKNNKGEYWIRWYPDACQVFNPVSGITKREQEAYHAYRTQCEQGGEDAEHTALAELLNLVGFNRARQILLTQEKQIGLNLESGTGSGLKESFASASLFKILPDQVRLYTAKWKYAPDDWAWYCEDWPFDINELQVTLSKIPADLRLTLNNLKSDKKNWINDFDEAVRSGMGVKITNRNISRQLDEADWLFVVGFRDNDDCDEILKELFMRKRAVGALDVVPQDTPTNNSEDKNSGYSTAKKTAAELGAVTRKTPAGGLTAADILGAVFGFNPSQTAEAFGYIENGDTLDYKAAMAMFSLLYPACTADFWNARGFYTKIIKNIDQHGNIIWGPPVFCRYGESHLVDCVLYQEFRPYLSARGAVPILLLDKNPYGILPIRSLKNWSFSSPDFPREDAWNLLYRDFDALLKPIWQSGKSVQGGWGDDIRNLLSIISYLSSQEICVEKFREDRRVNALNSPTAKTLKLLPIPKDLYFTTQNKDSTGSIHGTQNKLIMSLLTKGDIESLKSQIDYVFAYLKALPLDPKLSSSQEFDVGILKTDSLFSVLVKKSLLRIKEKYEASRAERAKTNTSGSKGWETETLQMLEGMRQGIKFLAEATYLDQARLEILLKEIVDLFFSRYDAWRSMFSTRRLLNINLSEETATRNLTNAVNIPAISCPNQNLVGVFGWLENPGKAVETQATNAYFQAPSANQVVAAAMLRNAALTPSEDQKPFLVNLSSHRTKEAVWFVEGLQKGYSQAELYGMRLERLLHDQKQDALLYKLRTCYPQDTASGISGLSSVTDGDKFLADAVANPAWPTWKEAFKQGNPPDAICDIAGQLRQIQDSVSNLFIAELAYHVAAGNTAMVNAWLAAMEMKNPPPKLFMSQTPRTGKVLTQKVVWPVSLPPISEETNPRVIAEPTLAHFCQMILTDLEEACVTVSVFLRPEQTTPLKKVPVRPAKDLDLCAFDLVLGGKHEFEALAKKFILQTLLEDPECLKILHLDADQHPEILFDQQAYLAFDYQQEKPNLFERASKLLLLIKSSQPLAWEDVSKTVTLGKPEQIEAKIATLEELYKRLEKLAEVYQNTLEELRALKIRINKIFTVSAPGLHPIDFAAAIKSALLQLRPLLTRLVKFGFPEANLFFSNSPYFLIDRLHGPIIKYPEFLSTIALPEQPGVIGSLKPVIPPLVKMLNALLELLGKRNVKDALKSVLMYQFTESDSIRFDRPNNEFVAEGVVLDDNLKLCALNRMIDNAVSLLKAWTSKDTLTVLPPFQAFAQQKIVDENSADSLQAYRNVRKNLALLFRVTSGIEFTTIKEAGILKNLEEIKAEIKEKILSNPDLDLDTYKAIERDLQDFSLDGRRLVDVYYLLSQPDFAFQESSVYAGLKLDEWTDFIHNTSEVTGIGFKFQTPKSQAPNVILVAVPEYEYPKGSKAEWEHVDLAHILAEALRLMYIRSIGSKVDKSERIPWIEGPVLHFKTTKSSPLLK